MENYGAYDTDSLIYVLIDQASTLNGNVTPRKFDGGRAACEAVSGCIASLVERYQQDPTLGGNQVLQGIVAALASIDNPLDPNKAAEALKGFKIVANKPASNPFQERARSVPLLPGNPFNLNA